MRVDQQLSDEFHLKCTRCAKDLQPQEERIILAKIFNKDMNITIISVWCTVCATLDLHIIKTNDKEKIAKLAQDIRQDVEDANEVSSL